MTPIHAQTAFACRAAAFGAALLLVFAALGAGHATAPATAVATAAPAATSAPAGAGPTLATEDTMHTDVPEVLVSAPRVTLDEILDRVARGEARRDSLLRDQSFTATFRVVHNTVGHGTPERFVESVFKVYKKKPGLVRTVALRKFEKYPDKSDDGSDDSDFSPGMGEGIVNFAFRPENRRGFRFTIEARRLLGDHLLYTLRFEPRSALAVFAPRGRVWVDTRDFVILRQELDFLQSPVPLLLKSIRHLVVERERMGDFWVLSRALVRMELTLPVPKLGRSFDVGMAFTDYTVNTGLPDSLFDAPKTHERGARMRVTVGGGKGRRS